MGKVTIIPEKYRCRMCGEVFNSGNIRICNVDNYPTDMAEVLHKIDTIPHNCMSNFINSKKVLEIVEYPVESNYLTFCGIADCIGVKILAQTEEGWA